MAVFPDQIEQMNPTSTAPSVVLSPPAESQMLPAPEAGFYDDESLHLLAAYLAKEMEFDMLAANLHSTRWYREQIGPELCSPERAAALRRMAVAACLAHHGYRPARSVDVAPPLPPVGINRGANRVRMGLAPYPARTPRFSNWMIFGGIFTLIALAWAVGKVFGQ